MPKERTKDTMLMDSGLLSRATNTLNMIKRDIASKKA